MGIEEKKLSASTQRFADLLCNKWSGKEMFAKMSESEQIDVFCALAKYKGKDKEFEKISEEI
jgi:hypothetical protein